MNGFSRSPMGGGGRPGWPGRPGGGNPGMPSMGGGKVRPVGPAAELGRGMGVPGVIGGSLLSVGLVLFWLPAVSPTFGELRGRGALLSCGVLGVGP